MLGALSTKGALGHLALLRVSSLGMVLYDLTRPLVSGMPVYPGDPAVQITSVGSPPWQISLVQLGSHSGTHLDAPRHRVANGVGIDAIPIERLIGPGIVIDARGYPANSPLGPEVLANYTIAAGMIVVIRTGWEAYWGSNDYFRHPYVSTELAQALVNCGVTLVGIDTLSVDSTVDSNDTAHVALLANNILIAENLCNLTALQCGARYFFACIPLPLVDTDGSPARVFAWSVRTMERDGFLTIDADASE